MECQQREIINLVKIKVFVKLLQIVGSSKFVPRIGGVLQPLSRLIVFRLDYYTN